MTGGLAGAVYGVEGIPERRLEPLHVPLAGFVERVLRAPELILLTTELVSAPQGEADWSPASGSIFGLGFGLGFGFGFGLSQRPAGSR